MRFDWALTEVTITFHGADSLYELTAYDALGTSLGRAQTQAALGGGPHTITVSDARGRIRKVEFGEERSVTIITELRYR